jgi:hypothetical protein
LSSHPFRLELASLFERTTGQGYEAKKEGKKKQLANLTYAMLVPVLTFTASVL